MSHNDDGRLSEIDGDVVVGGNLEESQQAFSGTVGRAIGQKRGGISVVRRRQSRGGLKMLKPP